MRRDGLIEAIGLCNVNLGQIEEARQITDIATVQVELSVWHDDALLDGVAEDCAANRIALIAHRPLGGATRLRRTAGDQALKRVAAAHDATPFEVAIAWVRALADVVVPIAGPTRLETVRSVARAHALTLTDDDRAALDDRFPSGSRLRGRGYPAASPANGEIVLIMGLPGAGKSTLAREYVADGFVRLNRDDAGGSLAALAASLDEHLAAGNARCVLDNTYVSRKSRAGVIEAARRRGVPVRCVWLTTPIEEAQVNAVRRILSRYPAALGPEGLRQARRKDVAAFGPSVQSRYARDLEPPGVSEGFASVEQVAFERRPDPAAVERAVLIWCDGVLWQSRSGERTPSSPDDVETVPGRVATLARYAAEGWRVLGLSWQPEVEAGTERTPASPRRSRMRHNDSACQWRSSTARTAPGRPSAGAASRCRAWASCSSIAIISIRRDASTSASGRRTLALPGGLGSVTARRGSSSVFEILRRPSVAPIARRTAAARPRARAGRRKPGRDDESRCR